MVAEGLKRIMRCLTWPNGEEYHRYCFCCGSEGNNVYIYLEYMQGSGPCQYHPTGIWLCKGCVTEMAQVWREEKHGD